MIVVSDTSAIINLDAVGQLEILRQLYGHVLLPAAVVAEITAGGSDAPGVVAIQRLSWIGTRSVTNAVLVRTLQQQLDSGEAEAIALALETRADLLLMDERRARQVATHLGLKVTGLVGALLEAKQRGLLGSVKTVLDDLVAKAGFWISRPLYEKALRAAGE